MNTSSAKPTLALTLIELLVVVVILAVLAAMFVPAMGINRAYDQRIQCLTNLKKVGLAFRIWQGDHGDEYPMSISATNGGTKELIESATVWRHFQVLSNELLTPKILCCPSDPKTKCATNFTTDLSNQKISYFLGVDAKATNAPMFLAGDHNITNGLPVKSSLLILTTNQLAGWTRKIHDRQGTILMADACVQQFSTSSLRDALRYTGVATNRLAMP